MVLTSFTPSDDADTPSLARAEFVYRQLRAAIASGELVAGTRLREVELAARLGVSRTPVREALRRLSSEGTVTDDAQRGIVVTALTMAMVQERYVVRESLEGTAAALAATQATPLERAALRTIADRDLALQGDVVQLVANNRLFHQTLYRAAHNHYLLKTLEAVHESLALLSGSSLTDPSRVTEAVREHQMLVQAIERHDVQVAQDMARAHIRGACKVRLAQLSRAG